MCIAFHNVEVAALASKNHGHTYVPRPEVQPGFALETSIGLGGPGQELWRGAYSEEFYKECRWHRTKNLFVKLLLSLELERYKV
jgi:hypothetical protein